MIWPAVRKLPFLVSVATKPACCWTMALACFGIFHNVDDFRVSLLESGIDQISNLVQKEIDGRSAWVFLRNLLHCCLIILYRVRVYRSSTMLLNLLLYKLHRKPFFFVGLRLPSCNLRFKAAADEQTDHTRKTSSCTNHVTVR